MATLREIEADLLALETLLLEVGGDVSDEEADAAIDQWLEETSTALAQKLDGYGTLIAEAEERARARREEADRLASLAQMDASLAKRLKDRLRWFMERGGRQEIQTKLYRFRVAQNGGQLPVIIRPGWRPWDRGTESFVRTVTTYEWDKAKIRAALESGQTLAFAELGKRGRQLRVR